MDQRRFSDEAERCRAWAAELAGRPDATMLLRIAHAFDELMAERGTAAGWVPARIPSRRSRPR